MKLRGYKLKALFIKDLRLSAKNKNVLIVLLMPVMFASFYTYIYGELGDAQGMRDFTTEFVLMLCQMLLLTAIPLSVQSAMIAEEKEKNTMRTLMLSDVSSMEFLFSKSLVSFFYMTIITILDYLICGADVAYLPMFLVLSLFTAFAVIFFGSMVGILSKDQASAGTLSTPLMILFLLPAAFAGFNDTIGLIARVVPTYSFQLLFESYVSDAAFFTSDNLWNAGVIIAWIIIGILVFRYAYRKNLQDN